MMRALVAIFLLVWPGLALAEPYYVRSGEHAGFSRLYIRYGSVPDWVFGRVQGGYELRPQVEDRGYELSTVFDLIPRTRISQVGARQAGRLFVALGCECHAVVFEVSSGLVVDVKDGAAPADSRFEARLDPPAGEVGTPRSTMVEDTRGEPALADPDALAMRFPADRTAFAWATDLALDLGAPRPSAHLVGGMPAILLSPATTVDAAAAADPRSGLQVDPEQTVSADPPPRVSVAEPGHDTSISTAPSERAAALQEQLVAQVGRAAAEGLIEADLSRTERRVAATGVAPENAVPERPDRVPAPRDPAAELTEALAGGNIHIETAIDRGMSDLTGPDPMTAEGSGCLPDRKFDLTSWGKPVSAEGKLVLERGSVFGEFDEVDPDGLATLAKNYLYLTFGAEARALIETLQPDITDAGLFLALADIMDDGATGSAALPRDQMACPSRAAMWAMLADAAPVPGIPIATEAVLTSFAELPLHLRRHLGPALAERFLDVGDTDSASAVRNAIARAPGNHGEGYAMMEAEISIGLGDAEHGAELFGKVADAGGTLAPEAVVRLIDTALASGQSLPADIASTAGSLAFEARGTHLGNELTRVRVRALAYEGEVPGALVATEDALQDGDISAETAATLRAEIFERAVGIPDDAEFLKLVLAGPVAIGENPRAAGIRRGIAERLLALGLPAPARSVLAERIDVPDPADRRLYARSYLAERRPELAIGYLAGLKDRDSLALRARAHEQAGEYDRAAALYTESGDAAALARAVWRGEDWARAVENGTVAEQAAAQLALQSAAGSDQPGPLARNRALLEHSGEARAALAKLLATTEMP